MIKKYSKKVLTRVYIYGIIGEKGGEKYEPNH